MSKAKKINKSEPEESKQPEVPSVFANPSGIPLSADNVKVELTEEDKERFFKSFISDSVFEDFFELFDKKVKVTFKSISVAENNDILNQVNEDWKSGIASTSQSYITTILIYRFAMSLVAIDGFEFSYDITKDNFDKEKFKTYIQARVDKFKEWNTFKLSAFLFSFLQFEKKLLLLEQAVNDVGFWKADV